MSTTCLKCGGIKTVEPEPDVYANPPDSYKLALAAQAQPSLAHWDRFLASLKPAQPGDLPAPDGYAFHLAARAAAAEKQS